jgi:hypothetical protein
MAPNTPPLRISSTNDIIAPIKNNAGTASSIDSESGARKKSINDERKNTKAFASENLRANFHGLPALAGLRVPYLIADLMLDAAELRNITSLELSWTEIIIVVGGSLMTRS